MSNIIKLGMVFDESTAPDFGDIAFDKEHDLILTSPNLPKLVENVTRAVCGAAFNIPIGTRAQCLDTGDVLEYLPDSWHYIRRSVATEMRYGNLRVVIKKNGANFLLSDDEKIIFSVISDNETIISKEMKLIHYSGQGIYAYRLNMEDAHALALLGSNYTISVAVYSGETDITDTVTIKYPTAEEWYDVHVKYDTGV